MEAILIYLSLYKEMHIKRTYSSVSAILFLLTNSSNQLTFPYMFALPNKLILSYIDAFSGWYLCYIEQLVYTSKHTPINRLISWLYVLVYSLGLNNIYPIDSDTVLFVFTITWTVCFYYQSNIYPQNSDMPRSIFPFHNIWLQ